MSNVRSSPMGPPISRHHLDTARRPFRVLLGILFVGYSSIGTIVGVQSDLAPALAQRPDGAMLGLAVGIGLALAIFVAEVLLAEAALGWYIMVLIPDSWYTIRFSDWIGLIMYAHMPDGVITRMSVVLVTAVFSIAVAYFGERLLFGKRR
jgi:hypothetical protein